MIEYEIFIFDTFLKFKMDLFKKEFLIAYKV